MNISQLNSVDSLSESDLFAVWQAANSDTRKVALSVLLAFIEDNLTPPGSDVTQYAAPSASGFDIAIAPVTNGQNMYLLLTPTGEFAAGTITLPNVATCVDGQTVLVSTTQAVTALTINVNGANGAPGAPTTLAANAFFKLRFDGVFNNWYRVG